MNIELQHKTPSPVIRHASVLLTGATGRLGNALLPKLVERGVVATALTRRSEPIGNGQVTQARGDLKSGEGLAEAIQGHDVVIHAASNTRDRGQVDIAGTRALLRHASSAGVKHFIYVSIVGVDRNPTAYYEHKVEGERLVADSGVPWTILRSTQFHSFIDGLLANSARLPVMVVPGDFAFQPVDVSEVADGLAGLAVAQPALGILEFGGPEIRRFGDLAREWKSARHIRRPMLSVHVPGKVAAAFRSGAQTSPNHRDGTVTWAQWLAGRYGAGS